MEEIFFEISVVLITGTLFATIAKFLKQPMIPAYILAGVVLGPPVFHLVENGELLETLSTFGIAFLLFLVGIELDVRKFLKTGKVSVVIGAVQMSFAVGVGYFISRALGFNESESFFLALALGFSSTIVIMKLLGEKKQLDTLYGQIAIGLMLTQDFIAIAFLLFFGVFTGDASGSALGMEIGITLIKGFFLISLSLLSTRFILTHVFKYFAHSGELLFLGAISWNLVFAMLAILLGFSIEVGSLLAGISLSFVPYSIEISTRIKSLRDFFLPIFFAVLGAQLTFDGGSSIVLPVILFSSLVLFASPVLVTAILLWFGYRARTSFQVGISIAQISEFSFIVVTLGYSAGLLDQNIIAMVALIGLITMTLSTYMVEYTDFLYGWFRPILKKLERKGKAAILDEVEENIKDHVVLFGYHTMGIRIGQLIEKQQKEFVIIDNNPDVIKKLKGTGFSRLYGSMNDEEVLENARVHDASFIVSTVPDKRATLAFLEYATKHQIKANIIVSAFHVDDAIEFYKAGATYVIYPTLASGDAMKDILKARSFTKRKADHLKQLRSIRKIQSV